MAHAPTAQRSPLAPYLPRLVRAWSGDDLPRARVLDGSLGGLGGCPFAPRATGNVATEDVLYLLEREGVEKFADSYNGAVDTIEAKARKLAR